MRNFNYPYFSRSIPEFWRRWHISLTTWFRDYIYFPLGGSRCTKWKIIRNVFIVWGISGLWHGANWTFVCWGLFHAALLTIYNLLNINTKYKDVVVLNFKSVFQMGLTFFLAMIGWIIFRAESLSQAVGYFWAMFTNKFFDITCFHSKKSTLAVAIGFSIILLVAEWLQRDKQHALDIPKKGILRYHFVRLTLYAAIFIIIFVLSGDVQTFIYFQF